MGDLLLEVLGFLIVTANFDLLGSSKVEEAFL
jgi:hypothetical protein